MVLVIGVSPSVAEDDRYLFLLTQRYAAVDGRKYVHNEDNFRYVVYDKETREGFVTTGEEGTRFTDDILALLGDRRLLHECHRMVSFDRRDQEGELPCVSGIPEAIGRMGV